MENGDPIKFWQHIHSASVHFPIALIICALAFDLGSTLFKRPTWRIVGFWCLFAGAVIAVPATTSGLAGYNGWFGIKADPDTYGYSNVGLLFGHRNLALLGTGLAILLSLWRIVRKDNLKSAEWHAYLFLLFLATVTIGVTGYMGAYVRMGSDWANVPQATPSPSPSPEPSPSASQ